MGQQRHTLASQRLAQSCVGEQTIDSEFHGAILQASFDPAGFSRRSTLISPKKEKIKKFFFLE
jgi:hypothetical protein